LSSIVRRAELAQHSIVITPFEDLDEISMASNSARSSTSAFAAAIKAAKGIQVSSAGELPIKGETDSWRPEDWKRVGEAAGARMVLSGSVREREGKQRVALHLVETATGSIVNTWLQDSGSISDAARASALEISDILGRSEAHPADRKTIGGTNNLSARSYYERGRELFFRYNLADQARAIDSFRTAVRIDPNYAQAHAILASACQARSVIDPEGKWLEQAETATAAALRLAPMLPESHRAHAGNLRIKGFLRASLDSYLTAYELDPSNGRAAATLGNVYDFLGRPDLAISWFEKATRREARPFYADNFGDAWMDLGDYAEAEKAYQVAAVFRPDLPTGILGLSRLALFRGDYENARRQCEDARAKYKDNPQPLIMAALVEFFSRHFDAAEQLYGEALASDRTGGVEFVGSVRFLSAIGFIKKSSTTHAEEGRALLEDARALDKKELSSAPENSARLYSLAADEAALDQVDVAIVSLDKAITAGWIDYRSMELDPRFDSIRDTQAFRDILSRLIRRVEEMKRPLSG
jgi:tetratricopeptide (TPR) repeat protein